MSGTSTVDIAGRGVRVADSSAATTLGNLSLTSITGPAAIDIQNVTGSVSLFDDALIDRAVGDGILIRNLSGSFTTLGKVDINNRNGVGVNLLDINTTGTVNFGSTVTMGTPNSGGINSHGINYEGHET